MFALSLSLLKYHEDILIFSETKRNKNILRQFE